MTEDEILAILEKFADYLQIGDMFQNGIRIVGMLIVKGLVWFIDTITGNFTEVLGVLNFRNNDAVTELMNMLRPIQNLLLGIAILAVGVVLYLGKNAEMRNIPLNVFLIICTLAMLPNLVTQGVRLTEAIGGEVVENQGGLGFKTFKNNTVDIYELGAKGWTTDELENRNYLDNLDFFDINERITDAKKVDPDGVLDYEARNKVGGKGHEVKKIKSSDSVLDFFVKQMVVPTYYRWRVFWIPVLITLIALAGATGLFVIRAGRLGIEVAFNYIWANITAFVHIRDLRKFKQACFEIFVGLITLAALMVLFYLYIAFNTFVSNGSEHILVKALVYVGGAWLLYDGPAIIQKQVGVDAGLSTAGGVLAGFGAGKALDAASNTAKAAGGAAVGGTGMLAGILQGIGESRGNSDGGKKSDDDGLFGGKDRPDDQEDSSGNDNNTEEDNEGINDKLDDPSKNSEDKNPDGSKTPGSSEDDSKGISDQEEETDTDSTADATDQPGVNSALDEQGNSSDSKSTSPMEEMDSQGQTDEKQSDNSEKTPGSEEAAKKTEPPKKPVKPKHPIGTFIKNELATPKNLKGNKGVIGNTYESASKGHALGKDLVNYTKERKVYKQENREYKDYKKNKGSDK